MNNKVINILNKIKNIILQREYIFFVPSTIVLFAICFYYRFIVDKDGVFVPFWIWIFPFISFYTVIEKIADDTYKKFHNKQTNNRKI